MFAKPQSEHQWLEKLLGEWVCEGECDMGPDQPKTKHSSKVTGRSLGGLWFMLEMFMPGPEGESPMTSFMNLGYDPEQQKYVGTFFGSMMAQQWVYSGTVDAGGKKLTLDTRGPKFDGSGQAAYQDIIEWTGAEEWTLSSQVQQDDGTWKNFMTAVHKRVGA